MRGVRGDVSLRTSSFVTVRLVKERIKKSILSVVRLPKRSDLRRPLRISSISSGSFSAMTDLSSSGFYCSSTARTAARRFVIDLRLVIRMSICSDLIASAAASFSRAFFCERERESEGGRERAHASVTTASRERRFSKQTLTAAAAFASFINRSRFSSTLSGFEPPQPMVLRYPGLCSCRSSRRGRRQHKERYSHTVQTTADALDWARRKLDKFDV